MYKIYISEGNYFKTSPKARLKFIRIHLLYVLYQTPLDDEKYVTFFVDFTLSISNNWYNSHLSATIKIILADISLYAIYVR